jgi:predicted PurR-regulated permease PerM
MAALLATVAVGALALRGQATVFIERLPSITERLRESVREGRGSFGSTVQPVQQAAAELKRVTDGPAQAEKGVTRVQVEQAPMRLSDFLWRGTLSVFGVLVQATMVLFLVYYLLASGDQYKRKLLTVIGPSLFHKRLTVEILNQITEQIGRFIMARLLISVMVGAATGLSLRWLGVSQPAVWGFAAGVLNNIPYLGPVAACVGIALAGLVQFGTIGMAGVVGGVAGAIAAIEGLVITPWIMGRAGRMNTGIVFVSLMFWGWVWGIWGLLFAVPIMMAVKAVCDHIEDYDFVSEFLRE